ncbi:MAG: hypothetical protein O3A14_16095 [Cyanobacteria bacterium]|nr:hypothetical protein [Cyanobacteriota bacterium]
MSNLGAAALATTIELNLLPVNGPSQTCPATLVAHETLRPYFEGGFATDGMIKLRDIATDITLSQSDLFSASWVGTLKPQYRDCEASAIINSIDGEVFQGHSFLRVQLVDGQARVSLDMTGIEDANGYTSVILFKGIREGNPRWAWGGTD